MTLQMLLSIGLTSAGQGLLTAARVYLDAAEPPTLFAMFHPFTQDIITGGKLGQPPAFLLDTRRKCSCVYRRKLG